MFSTLLLTNKAISQTAKNPIIGFPDQHISRSWMTSKGHDIDTIILVLCYILPMELHIHWNTMGIQSSNMGMGTGHKNGTGIGEAEETKRGGA